MVNMCKKHRSFSKNDPSQQVQPSPNLTSYHITSISIIHNSEFFTLSNKMIFLESMLFQQWHLNDCLIIQGKNTNICLFLTDLFDHRLRILPIKLHVLSCSCCESLKSGQGKAVPASKDHSLKNSWAFYILSHDSLTFNIYFNYLT